MRSSSMLLAALPGTLAAIRPRNFIFVIPDGMSPYAPTMARFYQSYLDGEWNETTPLATAQFTADSMPVGTVNTYSANNAVPDSAAAGTAFASGVRTNNRYLGVTPDGQAVGTVLEAAKMAGFMTGLVVTSVINHATPAAFSSHVLDRELLDDIANQQVGLHNPLGQSVDVLYGGGRCSFYPMSNEDSCRSDEVDLFAFAEAQGYTVTTNRTGFNEQMNASLPILGLYNDGDLHYDIARQQQPEDEREPSLTEMTMSAIRALSNATACPGNLTSCRAPGFFLMVESSRIDHSGHGHDDAANTYDVLEYYRVLDFLKEWIDVDQNTALIAAADHETGGWTLPSGIDPSPIGNVTHSAEFLAFQMLEDMPENNETYIRETILPQYGIDDPLDEEVEELLLTLPELEDNQYALANAVADLLNNRTGSHWGTGGHTAGDVNLLAYAYGQMGRQMRDDLAGHHNNTDLPAYIAESLGLDLGAVTTMLQEQGTEWIPTPPPEEEDDE